MNLQLLTISPGTYDVQRLETVECTQPNCIQIRVYFAVHSPAKGTLVLLLPRLDGDQQRVNVTRAIFVMLRRSASSAHEMLSLSSGDYQALAYDIEYDGTIHSGLPATRTAVSVREGSQSNGIHTLSSAGAWSLLLVSEDYSVSDTGFTKQWYV